MSQHGETEKLKNNATNKRIDNIINTVPFMVSNSVFDQTATHEQIIIQLISKNLPY